MTNIYLEKRTMKFLKRWLCAPVDWIEPFKAKNGKWHYRIRSEANGDKMSTSESYSSHAAACTEAHVQAARHGYKYREAGE